MGLILGQSLLTCSGQSDAGTGFSPITSVSFRHHSSNAPFSFSCQKDKWANPGETKNEGILFSAIGEHWQEKVL
jgi:hypothetical protein